MMAIEAIIISSSSCIGTITIIIIVITIIITTTIISTLTTLSVFSRWHLIEVFVMRVMCCRPYDPRALSRPHQRHQVIRYDDTWHPWFLSLMLRLPDEAAKWTWSTSMPIRFCAQAQKSPIITHKNRNTQ